MISAIMLGLLITVLIALFAFYMDSRRMSRHDPLKEYWDNPENKRAVYLLSSEGPLCMLSSGKSWEAGRTGAALTDFVVSSIKGYFYGKVVGQGEMVVGIDSFVNRSMPGLWPDLEIYAVEEAEKMLEDLGYEAVNQGFGFEACPDEGPYVKEWWIKFGEIRDPILFRRFDNV